MQLSLCSSCTGGNRSRGCYRARCLSRWMQNHEILCFLWQTVTFGVPCYKLHFFFKFPQWIAFSVPSAPDPDIFDLKRSKFIGYQFPNSYLTNRYKSWPNVTKVDLTLLEIDRTFFLRDIAAISSKISPWFFCRDFLPCQLGSIYCH